MERCLVLDGFKELHQYLTNRNLAYGESIQQVRAFSFANNAEFDEISDEQARLTFGDTTIELYLIKGQLAYEIIRNIDTFHLESE